MRFDINFSAANKNRAGKQKRESLYAQTIFSLFHKRYSVNFSHYRNKVNKC